MTDTNTTPEKTTTRRRRSTTSASRPPSRQHDAHEERKAAPNGPSRFDVTVISIALLLALSTALVAWRGDRVGIQIQRHTPAENASNVSVLTDIRITFDQPLDTSAASGFELSPPADLNVRVNRNTLIAAPAGALEPDTTYTVTVEEGMTGRRGRTMLETVTWQFHTGHPRIVYTADDAVGRPQLFIIDPDGTGAEQLTDEEVGIWGESSVSPDGREVAYASQRADGGSSLWRINLQSGAVLPLLPCEDADCSAPVWTPSGERILYERRTINPAGVPRLWWLVVDTGETAPVFQDSQQIGLRPGISPDGNWISYVSPDESGVRMLNLNGGDSVFVPTQMGEPAVWSPTSDAVLVSSVKEVEEDFYLHTLMADLATKEITDLSGDAKVDDRTPRWSPDGRMIAFWRRHIPSADADPSDELWVMSPDGSNARAIYTDPDVQHSAAEWSPDSRYVVFERYPLTTASPQSELWIVDVQTGESRELVTPATRPVWVP